MRSSIGAGYRLMSLGAELNFADPKLGTFPGLDCLALAERQGVPMVTADRRLHGRCMAVAAVRWGERIKLLADKTGAPGH